MLVHFRVNFGTHVTSIDASPYILRGYTHGEAEAVSKDNFRCIYMYSEWVSLYQCSYMYQKIHVKREWTEISKEHQMDFFVCSCICMQ